MSQALIRVLALVAGVLLASAAAGVFWAIVNGRRGRPRPTTALPAPHHIDRFYAPRVTLWVGRPQPTPSDFADIAAANADVDLDFGAYAELYLVPEETR